MPQINLVFIDAILNDIAISLFYIDFFNLVDYNDDGLYTYNLYMFTL